MTSWLFTTSVKSDEVGKAAFHPSMSMICLVRFPTVPATGRMRRSTERVS
jgi:hypothetical protein